MSADISKIKDRVRKLLNLAADDGAAEGEIDNALRAARRLMLNHQLSEDDVTAPPEDLRTPEQIAADTQYGTAKSWSDSSRVPAWHGRLAASVARFLATVDVYQDHPAVGRRPSGIVMFDGRPVAGWVFFGPHDDCVLASELHQELLLTCATTAKLKYGGSLMKGAGRDYCDGFANGLYEKLISADEAVAAEKTPKLEGPQCTALSVVRATDIAKAKKERANKWIRKEQGLNLRSQSRASRSVGNSGAYSQGKSDGASQSLTKTRTARIGQR